MTGIPTGGRGAVFRHAASSRATASVAGRREEARGSLLGVLRRRPAAGPTGRTPSGKVSEIAVRDVVHGHPVEHTEPIENPPALALCRILRESQG